MVVFVDREMLIEVCTKIIRGLEHYVAHRYVESPYRIDLFFLEDHDIADLNLNFGTPVLYLGPGFRVWRMAALEATKNVIYGIKIWDTWFVHATIVDESSDQ